MIFLIDAPLPPVLAENLTREGHFAKHVKDAGLQRARDGEIWDYAIKHNMIVVTKDFRFLRSRVGQNERTRHHMAPIRKLY